MIVGRGIVCNEGLGRLNVLCLPSPSAFKDRGQESRGQAGYPREHE